MSPLLGGQRPTVNAGLFECRQTPSKRPAGWKGSGRLLHWGMSAGAHCEGGPDNIDARFNSRGVGSALFKKTAIS